VQEQTLLARVKNFVFVSFWPFPLFLIIPVFTILNLKLHLRVSGDLLLYNNAAFTLLLAARFVWYLVRLRAPVRYGAERNVPEESFAVPRPASQLESELTGAGYRFESGGRYGEKPDLGYLGTTLLYGGLMLLLLFGSYDYLREYSIMVRLGVGEPMPLDGKGLTGEFEAGSLAGTSNLPKLQIRKQILPNAQYPKGATEIALMSKDDKDLTTGTLAPGKPFHYGGFDFTMRNFLFDGLINIRMGDYIVFDSFVKFVPLAKKKDNIYSYQAKLFDKTTGKTLGDAWLQPEKKAVLIDASVGGKKAINTVLELWGEHKKTQGEYVASLEGLAQWSEIRVARGRHRGIQAFGAAVALLGLLLRLAIRPQRVWLEGEAGGSRVKATGKKTLQLLGQ